MAGALGGGVGAKVIALSLALSVIATTGTSIVLPARIIYGMAGRRVLPSFLGTVSGRFATPVAASLVTGAVITGPTIVYLLATSLQSAFDDVANLSGQMFAVFYILTALAAVAYYRHRILSSAWDAILAGLLPSAAPPSSAGSCTGTCNRASRAAVVLRRHSRHRPDHDAHRPVRPAIPVLRHPRKARPGTPDAPASHSAPAVPAGNGRPGCDEDST